MHTVEYYTTVKRNALLLPAIRGMNFTDITLSRRSQIQRSSHGKFNLYKVKKKKTPKTGKPVQGDGHQSSGSGEGIREASGMLVTSYILTWVWVCGCMYFVNVY